MTTYDGKCAGFNTGNKRVVNREPLYVNKLIYNRDMENFYKAHRGKVDSSTPIVDTKVATYRFLENQTWKSFRDKVKMDRLQRTNEIIYEHITQVETQDGPLIRENKEHCELIEKSTHKMHKFRTLVRRRKIDQIQRENRFLHDRLRKIRPHYEVKKFDEFFSEHLSLMSDRRTDHTAGHIIGPAESAVGPLPPIRSSMSMLDRALEESRTQRSSNRLARSSTSASSIPSMKDCLDFIDGGPSQTSNTLPKARDGKSSLSSNSRTFTNLYGNGNSSNMKMKKKVSLPSSRGGSNGHGHDSVSDSIESQSLTTMKASRSSSISSEYELREGMLSLELLDSHSPPIDQKFILLVSRQMPLPFASKNCLVNAYCSREYEENIYLRVTSFDETRLLCERTISIDELYDILGQAKAGGGADDIQSLRALLVNMFREADSTDKGYLTYDEFQALMERVDLGISAQELRFVIAEADEDESGFIDYHEFVPLAVDMIQAFKARSKAKCAYEETEHAVEDEVLQSLCYDELFSICKKCMAKFELFDTKNVHALRKVEIRRCIHDSAVGLTNTEINMILQMLPRDAMGRLQYDDFKKVLHDVRVTIMRNSIIEAKGSEIQKYLVDLCKENEKLQMLDKGEDGIVSGWISQKSLIDLLINSPRLSLSRLQVMVICSEAQIVDGKVNYWKFIPMAANAIECMFDPKVLKQRAELMGKEDMSSERLLKGFSAHDISERLHAAFKTHAPAENAQLDPLQFRGCLESLDLYLSEGEISTIMAIVDIDKNGSVSFNEFCHFCAEHLVHMQREKHIRKLQAAILDGKGELVGLNEETDTVEGLQKILTRIFDAADENKTGCLTIDQLQDVFTSLDIDLSAYQLSVLTSEIDIDDDGMVLYSEFVPMCADIIQAFRGNKFAKMQKDAREEWARQKADTMLSSFQTEIRATVDFLRDRIELITTSIEDEIAQRSAVVQVVRDYHSGLNRTEANLLIGTLYPPYEFTPGSSVDGGDDYKLSLISLDQLSPEEHVRSIIFKGGRSRSMSWLQQKQSKLTSSSKAVFDDIPEANEYEVIEPGKEHAVLDEKQVIETKIELQSRESISSIESFLLPLSSHIERLDVYVRDVKRTTIMRGLLEEKNPSDLALQLRGDFENEAKRIWQETEDPSAPVPTLLPYNAVYHVLKNLNYLRLTQVQLLTIMSWSESYHGDGGSGIDYKAFANYAADVIVKLSDAKELEHRAEVIHRVRELGEDKVIGTLTAEELESFLKEQLTSIQESRGNIEEKFFHDVLRSIPKISLSERESASVAAVAPRLTGGFINWQEFLPWAFTTIYDVCRERLIGRRIALLKVTADPNDKIQLERLTHKIIDYIRLQHVSGKIVISFPFEETARRDSMAISLVQSRPSSDILHDYDAPRNRDGEELIRMCRLMPCITVGGSAKDQKRTSVPMMLRVVEVDTMMYPDKAPLSVYATSIDMTIRASLSLRLPSIGLVDREAAEQFATNLIDKVHIVLSAKTAPELRIAYEDP